MENNSKVKFIVDSKVNLDKFVANRMAEIVKSTEKPLFLLATGNSPVGVYSELIKKYKDGEVSYKDLSSFNLDEYKNVESFPQDAFKKFMGDNLFDSIDINKENTNFPDTTESYNAKLDAVKNFDFTILGVGTNGHIAFNEPGVSFETRTNEVVLTESTIVSNFPGRTEYPTEAITMGMFDIYNKSTEIILLAFGEGKRAALEMLVKGVKTDDCPITHFADHPNMTIVTDLEEFRF